MTIEFNIPYEKRTKEICNKYYKNFEDIEEIPKQFRSEEIINYFLNNLKWCCIPDKFKTKELCNKYFEKTKDIQNIPEQYLTQKMVNEYFEIKKRTIYIPDNFLTEEILNKNEQNLLIEFYLYKKLYLDFFKIYSKKNFTNNFLKLLIEIDYKNFDLIPDELKTEEIYNIYINITYLIKKVPQNKLTQQIINKYFERTKNINNIPDKFLTEEICNKYLETNKNFISSYQKCKIENFLLSLKK